MSEATLPEPPREAAVQVRVKLILADTGYRMLMLERSQLSADETELSWDIPGGKYDPSKDDQPQDAVRRKLREETGIVLGTETNIVPIAIQRLQPIEQPPTIRVTCLANIALQSPPIQHDRKKYGNGRWVTWEEAKALPKDKMLTAIFTEQDSPAARLSLTALQHAHRL